MWAFCVPIYGKDDAGRLFYFTVHKAILRHIPEIRPSSAFDAVYVIPNEGILLTDSDDTQSVGTPNFLKEIDNLHTT